MGWLFAAISEKATRLTFGVGLFGVLQNKTGLGALVHAQGLVDVVDARVDVLEALHEALVALFLDLEEGSAGLLGGLTRPVELVRRLLPHFCHRVQPEYSRKTNSTLDSAAPKLPIKAVQPFVRFLPPNTKISIFTRPKSR
jgi:hypothetical protein